jgi:hypothetical protein
MVWVNRVERLVAPISWFLRFRLGRRWLLTSIPRLASLASITTAIVTSLATLASIAIAISLIISVSVSISLGTLSTLTVWLRHGLVRLWFRIRCWLIFPVSDRVIWFRLRLGIRPNWLRARVISSLTTLASVAIAISLIISVSISLGTLSTLAVWLRVGVVWLGLGLRLGLRVASIYNDRLRLRRGWLGRRPRRARVISTSLASLATVVSITSVSIISVSVSLGTLSRLAIVHGFRHGFRFRLGLGLGERWFRSGVGVGVVWFRVMWVGDDINRLHGTVVYLHRLGRRWLGVVVATGLASLAGLAAVAVAFISVIILYRRLKNE